MALVGELQTANTRTQLRDLLLAIAFVAETSCVTQASPFASPFGNHIAPQPECFEGDGHKPVIEVRKSEAIAVATPRGGLEKEHIQSVVRSRIDEVRQCCDHALGKTPDLHGSIAVTFSIGSDGAVFASKIESATLLDDGVQTCVGRLVCHWTFDETGGGPVTVTYPFVFKHSSLNVSRP